MPAADDIQNQRIIRLVGVYDADGTIRGELTYWLGARFGRRHCALCDITHGSVRTRPEWTACTAELPVPFDTYHRDDQPDSILAATEGQVPVVLAETASRLVVLLAPGDIAACGGSIESLMSAITRAADDHGLEFRSPT